MPQITYQFCEIDEYYTLGHVVYPIMKRLKMWAAMDVFVWI